MVKKTDRKMERQRRHIRVRRKISGTEKNLKLSEYYLKMAVDAGLPRAKTKYEQYKSEYENELGR